MVEMLGVLAIIGVLSAGGIAGYAKDACFASFELVKQYSANVYRLEMSGGETGLFFFGDAYPQYQGMGRLMKTFLLPRYQESVRILPVLRFYFMA